MQRQPILVRKVTMTDIARQAGVSQQAVSAVLSGRKSTVMVSEATRARIQEVARTMGYRVDPIARGLVSGKSFLIGLLCRDTFAPFAYETLSGVQEILLKRDYSVVTYTHGDMASDELKHVQLSMDRRVDGLIVMPALDPDGATNDEVFAKLQKEGVPIVQMWSQVLKNVPAVVRAIYESGRQAVAYLADQGHKRIIHLTHADYQDKGVPGAHIDALDRARGYEDEMILRGLEPIIMTTPSIPHRSKFITYGQMMAQEVAHHPSRPTAVVAYNDYIAQGLIAGCAEKGIDVPGDISLIGSDNLEVAALTLPPLTTLDAPLRLCGQLAAGQLCQLIDGLKAETQIIPYHVIERASVRPV